MATVTGILRRTGAQCSALEQHVLGSLKWAQTNFLNPKIRATALGPDITGSVVFSILNDRFVMTTQDKEQYILPTTLDDFGWTTETTTETVTGDTPSQLLRYGAAFAVGSAVKSGHMGIAGILGKYAIGVDTPAEAEEVTTTTISIFMSFKNGKYMNIEMNVDDYRKFSDRLNAADWRRYRERYQAELERLNTLEAQLREQIPSACREDKVKYSKALSNINILRASKSQDNNRIRCVRDRYGFAQGLHASTDAR